MFNMNRARKNKIKMQNSSLFNIFDGWPRLPTRKCKLAGRYGADDKQAQSQSQNLNQKPGQDAHGKILSRRATNPLTILLLPTLRWLVGFSPGSAKIFATQIAGKVLPDYVSLTGHTRSSQQIERQTQTHTLSASREKDEQAKTI